ncbi:MAG: alpha/beta hydrolase fold domain-containing protein [Acutalibacteraceae bacterium]
MISKITAIIMAIVSAISNIAMLVPQKQVVYTDVAYGTHERQVMDIVFPAELKKNMGAVVYIHGGAWVSGDKSIFQNRIQSTSSAVNCISASINYRYASENIKCTDILKDIDKALAKIKSMAETRGVNCNKVMLVGVSAGAHLALLYSYAKKDTAPIKPCAVTSYCGPADLTSDEFVFNSTAGTPSQMAQVLSYLIGAKITSANYQLSKKYTAKISPVNYIDKNTVPTLVVQGTLDTVVNVNDTRTFVKKLQANKVDYAYYELPDSGHQLNNDTLLMDKTNKTLIDFINRYLG